MSLLGYYVSEIPQIKLKKAKNELNVMPLSGLEKPTYIEGNFYVHKHNPMGYMHIEDSRGMWFVPVHQVAEAINTLLESNDLLFIPESKEKKAVKNDGKFNIGDKVVKVLSIMGTYTGSYYWVVNKNKHKDHISVADTEDGEPYGHPDLHAYHKDTGAAFENIMPGCSSTLMTLDEAKKANVILEEDED